MIGLNFFQFRKKEISDKFYSHKEVLETLLNEIVKIDIGGAPDGSFYVSGLILPDEKTGFAIYYRNNCLDIDRQSIGIRNPYEKEAGLKVDKFDGSYRFEPWGMFGGQVDKIIVVDEFTLIKRYENNPKFEPLDEKLNSLGLTAEYHMNKIDEFNLDGPNSFLISSHK